MTTSQKNRAKFIIVGSGFAGIAAAVRLKQEGEEDLLILERAQDVGGVWRDNHYPGCACDVESHLYSLSFAPNPNWTRKFSSQPEIYSYLQECARKYDLMQLTRFEHEVKRMDWDEDNGEWRLQTNQGEFKAQNVVGAFGALSVPAIPKIKGMEAFKGETFHSATWPKEFDPKGKRLAVIGTGASAIQFIPEIQREAETLHIFQRTPAWVVPRLDGPISEKMRKAYKQFSLLQKLTRFKIYALREMRVLFFRHPNMLKRVEKLAIEHMHSAIKDPVLREKLTPNYRIGCKRILLSNTYYPALAQPNVQVHTDGIAEITEDGVIDQLGNKVEVDTLIFGTGFQITDLPYAHHIYGRSGRSMADLWEGSPKAYMGTTVAGFPNLYLLQGPNTGLGHTSVIYMIEAQIEHMIKTVQYMKTHELDVIEARSEAQERFVEEMDTAGAGTVWTAGGCKSWYLDQTGRNSTLWPGYTFSFRRLVMKLEARDYIGRQISSERGEDLSIAK